MPFSALQREHNQVEAVSLGRTFYHVAVASIGQMSTRSVPDTQWNIL